MRFKTQGVCSTQISFDLIDQKLTNVSFERGCPGNLQAIQILLEGMPARVAITKLKGIRCGEKQTSCVDQLCKAIEQALTSEGYQS